ncbi:cyclic nucleotide-binding domain-containing protein [bacterium]|nr:cyclic nucleotide-binding domain-containing protein [bacterium]
MITIEKILFLKRISIFSSLTSQELRMIAEVSHEEEFATGEVLFNEGQSGDCMYFVVEGRVKIFLGVTPVEKVLAIYEGGEFFGEMGLYDDKPRSASAMAIDTSRLLVLHKADFCELISEYPEVALGIMKVLNQRIRVTIKKLAGIEGGMAEKPPRQYSKENFFEYMNAEFLKAKKQQTNLSFLEISIGKLNIHSGGVPPGDMVSQMMTDLGKILSKHLRPYDFSANISPKKLVVLLSEANRDGVIAFERRVKKDIDKLFTAFDNTHGLKAEVVYNSYCFPDDIKERETMLSLLEKE